MLINPEILTIYILNFLFFIFATIAFIMSLNIVLKWDSNATTELQYSLEKRSYLTATIIKYIFYIKLPMFLFFIFTLDKISFVLPGAMCGAGVVNASEYATPLLFLKVINLYLFAYWITLDSEDMKRESQPYLKQKFRLFLVFYTLFIVEIILEAVVFLNIDIKSVVDCCGTIFSNSNGTYLSHILSLPHSLLLILFYSNFVLMYIVSKVDKVILFSFLNLTYILISLISLIAFFGTYIYELPTHHCPFCLLQQDYDYVGYLLYALLFIGTFKGLVIGFIAFSKDEIKRAYRVSLLFNMLYLVIVSSYPLIYFIKNGVWL
jgi:hypothetical protein